MEIQCQIFDLPNREGNITPEANDTQQRVRDEFSTKKIYFSDEMKHKKEEIIKEIVVLKKN